MQLIVGGIASGKRSYVASLGYGPEQMDGDPWSASPVFVGLEEVLREGPLDADSLARLKKKDVIVCCEVGQGIVPIDGAERSWRELVGRTCAQLAAEADRVVRMVCGIPVILK